MSLVGKAAGAMGGLMLSSGALQYFAFTEMLNAGKAGLDIIGSGVDNAWNKSEDKFRQTGEGIGEAIGGIGMVGANFDMLFHEQKRHGRWFDGKPIEGGVTEARMLNGNLYQELEGGGFRRASANGRFFSTEALAADDPLLKTLKGKGAQEGMIRTTASSSKFMKNQGFIRGALPFVGVLAAGFAIKSVLGFAGGIIDEAMNDEHRFRNIHYDSRFFNTQQDQMTNYQQLGSAMNNYQNRMQSTARIFHSR